MVRDLLGLPERSEITLIISPRRAFLGHKFGLYILTSVILHAMSVSTVSQFNVLVFINNIDGDYMCWMESELNRVY